MYKRQVAACYDFSVLNEWPFLKQLNNAVSWVAQQAYLGDQVQAVHNVLVGDTTTAGYRPLQYLRSELFLARPLIATDDTQLYSPKWYTFTSFNVILINPYPTGPIGQSQVLFDVSTTIIPPPITGLSATLPVPERYVTVIIAKATQIMLIRHLDDVQTAKAEGERYDRLATVIMQRERNSVAGKQTMFKPNRQIRWR